MVLLYCFLIDSTVDAGSLYALMAKEFLDLLNWHTCIKKVCCAGSSEPVGMNIAYICGLADSVYDIFQPAACKPFMGSFTADKQSRIIVST